MHELPVRALMSTDVLAFEPCTPFQSVVRALLARGVDAAPVVDGDRLLGVVSTSDLTAHEEAPASLARVVLGGRHSRQHQRKCSGRTAEDLMSAPAVTVAPDATVADALGLMERHHVGRLIVCQGERVVGVLTRSDILRVFLREDRVLREEAITRITSTVQCPSDVDVEVEHGVVVLRGWVEKASCGWAAVAAVRAVPGVVDVDDRLEYRVDDAMLEHLAMRGPIA